MRLRILLIGILVITVTQVGYAGSPHAVAIEWSPDGEFIAVAGRYGVLVYDRDATRVGGYSTNLLDSALGYESLSWNVDNKVFATVNTYNSTIAIWSKDYFYEPESRWTVILPTVSYSNNEIGLCGSVIWSSDGSLFALGHSHAQGLIYRLNADLQIESEIKLTDYFRYSDFFHTSCEFALSPDGTKIAYPAQHGTDGLTIQILDWRTERVDSSFPIFQANYIWSLEWDKEERITVGGCFAEGCGKVQAYEVETGEVLGDFESTTSILYLDWSPSGKYLALTVAIQENSYSGYVEIRDEKGAVMRRFVPDDNGYYSLSWHPDGTWIAVSEYSSDVVHILDVSDLPG